VTTASDPEGDASHKLATVIGPAIEAVGKRFGAIDHTVPPGSSLAGDDKHSTPFQLSHAVTLAMVHATDNLESLRTLTINGQHPELQITTRPYAAYPTLRAVLENASIAVWLLGAKTRDERLTRRFRLLLADGASRDTVARLTGRGRATVHAERLTRIRTIVDARGLSVTGKTNRVMMKEIVRDAAAALDQHDPDFYEALWRILSGATHGDLWASMMVTEHDPVGDAVDGVVTARITTPVRVIADLSSLVLGLTTAAIALYEERRTPVYPLGNSA